MPKIFDEKHHRRKSIRLPFYDYSQNGMYFITICVHNRACILGKIENGEMIKNDLGDMVEKCWNAIPEHFSNVILDAFVVMPNHIHGIVIIDNDIKNLGKMDGVGASIYRAPESETGRHKCTPLQNGGFAGEKNPMGQKTLGEIIRWMKGRSTFEIRKNFPHFFWQRNYHEHIIRNEQSYEKIAEYIFCNPQKWDDDIFFVDFC